MTKLLSTSKKSLSFPSPANINIWWNLGSMLGSILMIQIISGLILSMNYCPNINLAFSSSINIMINYNYGWLIRIIHINGASLFFMFMFIHILRGIYFFSFYQVLTWLIGVVILLMSMATAFLGYVLPWGQMSYWGATVITNLISAIPYLGELMVEWIWGGFAINNATLNRFFSLHFILPLVILSLVIMHLLSLHSQGSNNPMGLKSWIYMIPFHPYFNIKDCVGFIIAFLFLMMISCQYPFILSDPDNFILANPMITPTHIKPEWYFLFAYSILRSIPNKLGGVVCLILSIMILLIMPLFNKPKFNSMKFNPLTQFLFWAFIATLTMLTWLGGKPVEYPYILLAQIFSILYFMFFIMFPLSWKVLSKKEK